MKKLKPWRYHRRLIRAAAKIERNDARRADYFNELLSKFNGHNQLWYVLHSKIEEWPDVADMFIKVEDHGCRDQTVKPGEYRVNWIQHKCYCDALVHATNVETKEAAFIWFPRSGQTIIPCGSM